MKHIIQAPFFVHLEVSSAELEQHGKSQGDAACSAGEAVTGVIELLGKAAEDMLEASTPTDWAFVADKISLAFENLRTVACAVDRARTLARGQQ